MNLNDCMSCIRNLEGIVDFDACLHFSGELLEILPGSFFAVNSLKSQDKISDFESEFYTSRPWEIPLEFSILEKRFVPYISNFDLMSLKNDPLIIDIRSVQELK